MPSYNDYSIREYGEMIVDHRRTVSFVDALRSAIRPGSVVLDIGTGTGFFSYLACQFGAARVYAVESDIAIEVGKICAKGIPGSERITWIHELSTSIDLPEQVDVVVGDLHGVLPFFKGNIESMADARNRHLKPGGAMIPARDVLYAVPAHAPDEYKCIESPWRNNDYGIDLSPTAPYVFNHWWRAKPEPVPLEHLLSEAQCWGEIDYSTDEIGHIDKHLVWEINRAAKLHGLYVWFDGDLGHGFGFSNAPQLPTLVYGRAFFPFEHATEVKLGDIVRTRLRVSMVKGRYEFRWDSSISNPDGSPKARFEQSTFKARLILPSDLRKANGDYVPALTLDGQVTHAVLQAMRDGQCLQKIADSMFVRFPQRFKTAAAALDKVSLLSQKYG